MPLDSPVVPRQMLPPPTTTASSRPPASMAWAISLAIRSTVAVSMVSSDAAEAKASPDILRTMRRESPTSLSASGADDDLGEGHDARRAEHAGDGLLLVADIGLVEQHALFVPAVHASLDDLLERCLGLALVARDRLERGALGRDLVGRHLVPREVSRLRERDMHRDVVRQLIGPTLEHDGDGVDAAAGLLVEVGVDHLPGFGDEPAHPAHGDVLLEGRAQVVDLVVELADGFFALARHEGGQDRKS